ncbi:hypothetical protein [Flavobacterium sp. IB48]|uniref:hypothetical protein n=1 Tax=Flavobacterium sp. IB48 TaxID=2779375 RepID=UPI001E2AF6E9|nr:hypothetical protein [Flavobacterium sp. IB48]
MEKRKKVLLLHPQQRNAHRNAGKGIRIKKGRNFLKKDSKKLARFEKAIYICTPQNTESSLIDWEGKRKMEAKIKLQNFSNFFLQV